MDFSIITPSYNYGRFIGDCLASVARQEGVTFEHLVLDAGSTDNTAEVVAKYPHATFFQESDKGMSDAINKGFRKARGTWVMWLNTDDFLEPGALAAIREHASRHPDADVIYGTYRFIDAAGKPLRVMKLLPYSRFISMHFGCYVPSTATFLRRRTIIDEGHFLDERMRLVMDNEYYARLSIAGKKFLYYPKVLASFRIHEENLSGLGGLPSGTLDAELSLAAKRAESEAVRRRYGLTPFTRYGFTLGSDFLFYMLAWALKGIMKLPYYLLPSTAGTPNSKQ